MQITGSVKLCPAVLCGYRCAGYDSFVILSDVVPVCHYAG